MQSGLVVAVWAVHQNFKSESSILVLIESRLSTEQSTIVDTVARYQVSPRGSRGSDLIWGQTSEPDWSDIVN